MKLAVRYGKGAESEARASWARGWSAGRRCTRRRCSSPTCRKDPRYINLVDDARSELVIPMLIKDRCIGVFDLESPELDAFTKEHKELLTLLASQAAVAIENARLYEEVRRNEERIEKELRFAQRVQMALLPTELPKPLDDVDVAGRFEPARELGGDLHDFLTAGAEHAGRRGRRRVGQGRAGGALRRVRRGAGALAHAAAPLHAGSLQRGRRAAGDEHDPARAAARGVLLHALLRVLRLHGTRRDAVELRVCRTRSAARAASVPQIELPGRAARLVSRRHLRRGASSICSRTTCSCSAPTASSRRRTTAGAEFGARRLCEVVAQPSPTSPPREIVDAIFDAVTAVPRRARADRRHDGVAVITDASPGPSPSKTSRHESRLSDGLSSRLELVSGLPVSSSMCRPTERPPNDATSFDPPLHLDARALRRCTAATRDSTVISPVPSSTL